MFYFVDTDSLNSRERWNRILAGFDARVVYRSDLELSLRPYDPEDFDIVVVEAFGISDDIDLCHRLRQRFDCQILLYTQNAAEEFAVSAYQAGIAECISGYISSEMLQAKVNAWLRWLDRRQARPGVGASWTSENAVFDRMKRNETLTDRAISI